MRVICFLYTKLCIPIAPKLWKHITLLSASRKQLLLILLFTHCFTCQVFSQSNYYAKFDHLTNDDGLSNSIVRIIFKDSKGYVWFGTNNGLNRYDGYNFKVFLNDPKNPQSISGNRTSAIVEDTDGDLIVGTWDQGLSIYHPRSETFETFKNDPKNPQTIPSNAVTDVKIDAYGDIWIAMLDIGLVKFNKKTEKFTTYRTSEKNNNEYANFLYSIAIDKDGNIYAGFVMDGIQVFNPKTKKFAPLSGTDSNNDINAKRCIKYLTIDKKSNMWVSTEGMGLFRFDLKTGKSESMASVVGDAKVFKSVCEDKDGTVWIASDGGGLMHYDRAKQTNTVFKSEQGIAGSLSTNQIYTAYIDNTGIIWVGTFSGGVNILDRNKEKFFSYRQSPNQNPSLSYKSVLSVHQDSEETIWIGTDGGGVDLYNPKKYGEKFINIRKDPKDKNSLSSNVIKAIYQDREGAVWMGTFAGGLMRYDLKTKKIKTYVNPTDKKSENYIAGDLVWAIFEDSFGKFWISCLGRGPEVFDRKTEKFKLYEATGKPGDISHVNVMTIYEDSHRKLWMGTEAGGVNLYDRKNDRFIAFKNDKQNDKSLANNDVRTIFEDSKHRLWFGTTGGGLDLMNKDSITFSHFTTADGLPSNVIYGILEDSHGFLWLATTHGISKFDVENKTFKNYDKNDGCQSNEFTYTASLKDKKGKLYFGGIEGLNAFNPEHIAYNLNKPPVVLTDFQIFNQSVAVKKGGVLEMPINNVKEITLSYDLSVLTFKFVALNFTQTTKNQFAFMMDGFDKEWNNVGTKRDATYTHLDPGTYIFKVKACNNDGVWNSEETSLKIVITPPFWLTWWFKTLVSLLLVGLIYMWIRFRIRNIELQKKKLEQLVVLRTAEVMQKNQELQARNEEVQQQKEEIESQAELLEDTNAELMSTSAEIAAQRDRLEEQNAQIKFQNEQITSSIRYAHTIQQTILPNQDAFAPFFECFIIYKPKDIVSGDFYWFQETEDKTRVLFAVADCTGHGVPGAFMSLIGTRLLEEIVVQKKVTDPAQVLEILDVLVTHALKTDQREGTDGMDVGICLYEKSETETKIIYSAAKQPLYILKNSTDEINILKGQHRSIGWKTSKEEPVSFTNQTVILEKDDIIYLASDGFKDQNNAARKRIGTRYLMSIMQKTAALSMETQKEIFLENLKDWQQMEEQRDDITLIALKVK